MLQLKSCYELAHSSLHRLRHFFEHDALNIAFYARHTIKLYATNDAFVEKVHHFMDATEVYSQIP